MSASKSNENQFFRAVGLLVIALAIAWWFVPRYFVVGSPSHHVEASDLAMEFKKSDVAAHAKYDGKLVEVTGKFGGTSMRGSKPTVTVGIPLFNIKCVLPDSQAARAGALRGGQGITVRGRVRTTLFGGPELSPCKLIL